MGRNRQASTPVTWGSIQKGKGWDGLNNAAINVFNSSYIRSLVRELFQNSNDARQEDKAGKKKKLRVIINYRTVSKDQIPGFDDLVALIKAVSKEPANSGNEVFFSQALDSLADPRKIDVLEYADYNTTGLTGLDDDATSNFNALVLSEGQSKNKPDNSGGSYGIGKNSIFGSSKCRTVIYSSLNTNGEAIIQGVSKLASYKKNGRTHEGRIYLGTGNEFASIRDLDHLTTGQEEFLKRTEAGLTQIAIAPIKQANWVDEFATTILKNYWPLLDQDELEVSLRESNIEILKIDSKGFESTLFKYFGEGRYDGGADETEPVGNPLDFYTSFKKVVPKEIVIPVLGRVAFHVQELDNKETNRVAYIRNGMVIYTKKIHGFDSIGYCGVVYCKDVDGNKVLRMMEPPTHDSFDPSRLLQKSTMYSEKDGQKALKDVHNLIRAGLNGILDQYRKNAEEIPWLNDLLQSLMGESVGGSGKRTGSDTPIETVSRIGSDQVHSIKLSSVEKNSRVSVDDGKTVTPTGGKGTGGGGRKTGGKGSGSGGVGQRTKKREPLQFRIYRHANGKVKNAGVHSYKIKLKSEKKCANRDIVISQVGDSGTAVAFNILSVKDEKGRPIRFEEVRSGDEIVGYRLRNIGIPAVLDMQVSEPYNSAFTLSV